MKQSPPVFSIAPRDFVSTNALYITSKDRFSVCTDVIHEYSGMILRSPN